MSWRRVVGVLGLLAALSGAQSGLALPSRQAGTTWGRLGPPGPQRIVALAPAPNWPQQGLLLAVRERGAPVSPLHELVRTRDGGATWERLPAPANSITQIALAPGRVSGAVPVAFAVTRSGIYRSTDAGSTWQQALAALGDTASSSGPDPVFTLSPTFAADGLAFYAPAARLYRSTDGGTSWQQVLSVADAPLLDAGTLTLPDGDGYPGDPYHPWTRPTVFASPDVARDGLAVYAARGRVYHSQDGGATWTLVDVPGGQQVQQVLVAPDFASSQTLFLAAT